MLYPYFGLGKSVKILFVWLLFLTIGLYQYYFMPSSLNQWTYQIELTFLMLMLKTKKQRCKIKEKNKYYSSNKDNNNNNISKNNNVNISEKKVISKTPQLKRWVMKWRRHTINSKIVKYLLLLVKMLFLIISIERLFISFNLLPQWFINNQYSYSCEDFTLQKKGLLKPALNWIHKSLNYYFLMVFW